MLFNFLQSLYYHFATAQQTPSSTQNIDSSTPPYTAIDDDFIKINPIISIKDLQQVKLTPTPPPKSDLNTPFVSVNMRNLSSKQLNAIKAVKLKPSYTNPAKTKFEVRHPCLRELLHTRFVV